MPIQLALLGALPALAAMMYVDWLDAKRPEPRATLRRVALAGALSAIPVVLIGLALRSVGPADVRSGMGLHSFAGALYMSFVVAAIPEELFKMLSVLGFAWRRPEFDERMDGIVYGARAGLGFALVENVAYLALLPTSLSEYVSIFIGRAILAVPGHATWGGIIGYYGARRRFDGDGPGLLGGVVVAIVLHGLYDVWLFGTPVAMARGADWLGITVLGIPVLVYLVPAVIIFGGGAALRRLAMRAVETDDLAERARDRAARRRVGGFPRPPWLPAEGPPR